MIALSIERIHMLTDQQQQTIVVMYRKGFRLEEIAKSAFCLPDVVRSYVAKYRVRRDPNEQRVGEREMRRAVQQVIASQAPKQLPGKGGLHYVSARNRLRATWWDQYRGFVEVAE